MSTPATLEAQLVSELRTFSFRITERKPKSVEFPDATFKVSSKSGLGLIRLLDNTIGIKFE